MKKILAMLVTAVMVFGAVAAVADYRSEGLPEHAIEIMPGVWASELYLEDYPNPVIDRSGTITRAEFARTVVQLLALDGITAPSETRFYDVNTEFWASGYIATAWGLGIIQGDGNGNFRPDDRILVIEAAVMLARTLGYTPMVNELGGFPAGYIAISEVTGLTEDAVSVPFGNFLTRDMATTFVNNALDVPLMMPYTFGYDGVEFAIFDGEEEDRPLTTLRLMAHGDDDVVIFDGESFSRIEE